MDLGELSTMISTVGFPIAAFCLMWFTSDKSLRELRDVIQDLSKGITELREDIKERSRADG